jgi:TPR repeat protein
MVVAAAPLNSGQLKQRRGSLADSFSAPPEAASAGAKQAAPAPAEPPAEGADNYGLGCRAAASGDRTAAANAWLAAAAVGHRSAQRRLAFAHLAGCGVAPNDEDAAFYFGQAAAQVNRSKRSQAGCSCDPAAHALL